MSVSERNDLARALANFVPMTHRWYIQEPNAVTYQTWVDSVLRWNHYA